MRERGPLLKGLKLKEKSATNRVVATCCNSAMVLNFDDGKPWVSVYRRRLAGDVPLPTMPSAPDSANALCRTTFPATPASR